MSVSALLSPIRSLASGPPLSLLPMLSLDQLPLQAEGCRHLVTLITNYGTQYVKPTKGSGVMTDIGVALSQSCVSLHAWYFSRFDCQAMSDPSPPGGPPMLGSEQGDDADTRVAFVPRHSDLSLIHI